MALPTHQCTFYDFNVVSFIAFAFKGRKLYFMHYSCVVIILFNTGLYKSVFYLFFWKTSSFCLSVLFVFTACSNFDELFINFSNICIIIIFIVGVRCFYHHLSLLD